MMDSKSIDLKTVQLGVKQVGTGDDFTLNIMNKKTGDSLWKARFFVDEEKVVGMNIDYRNL